MKNSTLRSVTGYANITVFIFLLLFMNTSRVCDILSPSVEAVTWPFPVSCNMVVVNRLYGKPITFKNRKFTQIELQCKVNRVTLINTTVTSN